MKRVAADEPEDKANRSEQPIKKQGDDDLRNRPADRERQYHPGHVNRPRDLGPDQPRYPDAKRQQGQDDRGGEMPAGQPFPESQSTEASQP